MLNRLLPTLAAIIVLSACAPQRKPLPAPPPPAAAPRPVATATPAPPPADWRDAPVSPGTWRYEVAEGSSAARFGLVAGAPLATLTCDRAASQVALRRAGAAPSPVPLTITTSTATRAFTATPEAGPIPQLVLVLAARDPVLDAMAFSRGRFVIEVAGLPTLYLPARPEVGRLIEDCR
ncbi:MAG: hypothetical protein Q8R44_06615 [Novosphingobium sp.]|nr:hypothetical protein [Novosphingobium sp.]